ncbi:MAG: hypothetical protein WCP89_01825 [archaeon]
MDLNECKQKGFIKKTLPNKNLAKSMLEISNTDESAVKNVTLSQENIMTYVSVAYDSLREILEAICELNGYKVSNHICLGELLKEILKDFDFTSFDRFRFIRNGIKYYGNKIDLLQGKEIILKIFAMKKELVNKYIKDII